jgi:sterol desaturase/sphingolipid hydroxylase (fatty acid hydroxylase superfamily)
VFATEFAHPVEDVLVNMLGTILGPLLLGAHPLVFIAYVELKSYQSMEAHSGFNVGDIVRVSLKLECFP